MNNLYIILVFVAMCLDETQCNAILCQFMLLKSDFSPFA